jgi:hypothetical protein
MTDTPATSCRRALLPSFSDAPDESTGESKIRRHAPLTSIHRKARPVSGLHLHLPPLARSEGNVGKRRRSREEVAARSIGKAG